MSKEQSTTGKPDAANGPKDQKSEGKAEDAKPQPKPRTLAQDLQDCVSLLESSVSLLEPRFCARVLRALPGLRKRLDVSALTTALNVYYPAESQEKALLMSLLPDPPATSSAMDLDTDSKATESSPAPKKSVTTIIPEVDLFLTLLVLVFLLDQKQLPAGLALADHTVQRLQVMNRRTLDQLAAKIYFYYARFHELENGNDGLTSIRPALLAAQKTASLRNDSESLATTLTLLLRSYFAAHAYDQADALVSKVTFPDEASNNQLARWLYYVGRLRAIQLQYSEAHSYLLQAIRRAPQPQTAPGFFQAAHKLCITVEMLMGDIPDRRPFREPVLKKALEPYVPIVQSVRTGDLDTFLATIQQRHAQFKADGNAMLLGRLRHNVLKAALRGLSLAYSRIPLSVVSAKLGLESEEEAEYVVAKAVRDGVIEAGLDHAAGCMVSSEVLDVYNTAEPHREFDERIRFCLELKAQSVKAMRFPDALGQKELAHAEEARERERELLRDILLDEDLDDM